MIPSRKAELTTADGDLPISIWPRPDLAAPAPSLLHCISREEMIMGPAAVFLVILLVALGFGAYVFLMIFYPEWVGITGKSARKTMDEHKEGSSVDDSDVMSE
jgi:hypothetical protein